MTTRALVAGGARSFGSHPCELRPADGHRVYCLDNESSGRAGNVDHLESDDGVEYVRGGVRDPPELPDVDGVYHIASRAPPSDLTEHPVEIALTNGEGMYCQRRDSTYASEGWVSCA